MNDPDSLLQEAEFRRLRASHPNDRLVHAVLVLDRAIRRLARRAPFGRAAWSRPPHRQR